MIINKSREKVLVHGLKVLRSPILKAIGLMFSRKKKDFGLVFEFRTEARRSLHNVFVFYPIDVIFLDEGWKVVEMKENFRPFKFHFPKKKAKYMIELPSGTIARSKTSEGDIINFK